MQDLSAASILSLFGFDIIQLHLLLSKRRKTDSFEPVSASTQWIGLSSAWDTDFWSRHSGTMIEAHSAVRTAVVVSENHMFLLWKRSCVKDCLDNTGEETRNLQQLWFISVIKPLHDAPTLVGCLLMSHVHSVYMSDSLREGTKREVV